MLFMIDNTEIILPVLSILLGAAAFGWQILDYLQKQIGYLILKLECSYESDCNDPYLISKTKVENTSKNRIDLAYALLLIVEQPISFEKGIVLVVRKMIEMNLIKERFLKEPWTHQLLEICRHLDDHKIPFLEEHDFIVKLLPYYFSIHLGAGSYVQMSTTHVQKLKHSGIYSVYFVVIGRGWYGRRYNPSKARMVHDEVVVK